MKRWWPICVIWIAIFLTYSNVYKNSFLYDDEFLIQKNQNIRTWDGVEKSFLMSSTGGAGGVDSFYRPMQGVLYTFVNQIFGQVPIGFHLLNIILHALNATLIFVLAGRLGFRRIGALMAAILWALHPLHTEAVTYQSATADPLYTLWILAGLTILVPRISWGRVVAAGVLFMFALLSKESAIVFPALVMVCLFFLQSKRWNPKTYLMTLPFWIIAFSYLIARKTILNFDETFHFYKTANIYTENIIFRIFTFFATLPNYLALVLWPNQLHMDRSFPVFVEFFLWPVLAGACLMGFCGYVIWKERNDTRPLWAFGILWFLTAHVPHMGVLLPVNSFFLEHWLYLPSIGLFLCAGETLSGWSAQNAIRPIVAIIAIALAITTYFQNEIWATPISFYSNTLKYETKVARVENNLAMAYSDAHNDDLAIAHYLKAIEISDSYAQTHHNLALAYIRKGDVEQAISHLERALEIDSDFYHSTLVLAQIYQSKGDTKRANEYSTRYQKSLRKFQH